MGNFNMLAVLILILCISQTGFGYGSKCYACRSSVTGTCGSSFEDFKSTMKGRCMNDNWVCVKVVSKKIGGYQTIERGCGLTNYCEQNQGYYTECQVCSKDYCNSSVNALPTYTAIIVAIALAFNKLLVL